MVAAPQIDIGEYQYGFRDEEDYVFKSGRGLTRATVEEISAMKNEPDWMRDFRLKALEHFEKRPMPNWGADLSGIDFDDIFYYIRPAEKQGKTWEEVPEYIKNTFEKLGIPEAERKFLAGVGAQYESEVIYHSKTSRSRACSSSTWTPVCASTQSWSRSTSGRSSRTTTTSSPR
jgi:Fe-S cluster assembly protein SufB